MTAPDRIMPAAALLSVSDKTGLVAFAAALAQAGVALISTGGTAAALREAGLPVRDVAELTGFPEMLDGRVKTLHPAIHGGLLARRDRPDHAAALAAHGIAPIDLLAIDLYPFESTVARGADWDECVENIDIGGPALLRAAAKNHDFVTVLCDGADYAETVAAIAAGGVPRDLRRRLAATAYARCGAYDAAIAGWFNDRLAIDRPRYVAFGGKRTHDLRYGENPHQHGGFYAGGEARPGIGLGRQIQGKELSYNNLNDTDAAYELVAEFAEPAAAIIKHANPCGVAIADRLDRAYQRALAADPVSAYGGIVALNRPIDAATARLIAELFAEVVIAPAIDDAATAILSAKKALRVVVTGTLPEPRPGGWTAKTLAGGLLVQSRDTATAGVEGLKLVTARAPSAAELHDLTIAAVIAKHAKSNAIVLVKDGMAVGIGSGQTSRVDAARQAVDRAASMATAAGEPHSRAVGAVVASDAFFPFADGLALCLEAGVTAAIQPGGSKRDADVIACADRAGAAMVFSGLRSFRH